MRGKRFRFESLTVPLLLIIGAKPPTASKAKMVAVASLDGVQSQRLPGSLGLHKEYAAAVAALALPFL